MLAPALTDARNVNSCGESGKKMIVRTYIQIKCWLKRCCTRKSVHQSLNYIGLGRAAAVAAIPGSVRRELSGEQATEIASRSRRDSGEREAVLDCIMERQWIEPQSPRFRGA